MFLSDKDIREAIASGSLKINPWSERNLQPSSVDLHLGSQIREPHPNKGPAGFPLPIDPANGDCGRWLPLELEDFEATGYVLHPGHFLLAHTVEEVAVDATLASQVDGKSSLGRIGLQVHMTAGFIDPGYSGQITLEVHNAGPAPILLRAGMKIAQLFVIPMSSRVERPYGAAGLGSRYQGSLGAVSSRYGQMEGDSEGSPLPSEAVSPVLRRFRDSHPNHPVGCWTETAPGSDLYSLPGRAESGHPDLSRETIEEGAGPLIDIDPIPAEAPKPPVVNPAVRIFAENLARGVRDGINGMVDAINRAQSPLLQANSLLSARPLRMKSLLADGPREGETPTPIFGGFTRAGFPIPTPKKIEEFWGGSIDARHKAQQDALNGGWAHRPEEEDGDGLRYPDRSDTEGGLEEVRPPASKDGHLTKKEIRLRREAEAADLHADPEEFEDDNFCIQKDGCDGYQGCSAETGCAERNYRDSLAQAVRDTSRGTEKADRQMAELPAERIARQLYAEQNYPDPTERAVSDLASFSGTPVEQARKAIVESQGFEARDWNGGGPFGDEESAKLDGCGDYSGDQWTAEELRRELLDMRDQRNAAQSATMIDPGAVRDFADQMDLLMGRDGFGGVSAWKVAVTLRTLLGEHKAVLPEDEGCGCKTCAIAESPLPESAGEQRADESTVRHAQTEPEPLSSQIGRLADWIIANIPGEPSKGAIDCAIRIMKSQAGKIAELIELNKSQDRLADHLRDLRDGITGMDLGLVPAPGEYLTEYVLRAIRHREGQIKDKDRILKLRADDIERLSERLLRLRRGLAELGSGEKPTPSEDVVDFALRRLFDLQEASVDLQSRRPAKEEIERLRKVVIEEGAKLDGAIGRLTTASRDARLKERDRVLSLIQHEMAEASKESGSEDCWYLLNRLVHFVTDVHDGCTPASCDIVEARDE